MRRSPIVVIAIALTQLLALAAARAEDDPVAGFKAAYGAPNADETARLAAVNEIAKIQSQTRVCEALAGVLARDASAKVRKAAAEALGDQWNGPKAAEALGKALVNPKEDDEVVTSIITALGETQTDAAVAPLSLLLSPRSRAFRGSDLRAADKVNVPLTTAALAALKHNASAKAIEPLLDFLSKEIPQWGPERRREKVEAVDPLVRQGEAALVALTGEHYEGVKAWTGWWVENKAKRKTYPVHRCDQTGKTYDRANATAKCPVDGDAKPKCGTFLRTRLEGGWTGEDEDKPERPERRGKKKK
jgi:hypothetical protein